MMIDTIDVINNFKNCKTLSDIKAKDLFDAEDGYAHVVAKKIGKLNTNQIRKIFGEIKKMEQKTNWSEIETDFYLLKPKMAAAVGKDTFPRQFYNVLIEAMAKVDNVEDDELKMKNFDVFVKFFKAVVAYRNYEDENSKNRRGR